MALDTVQDYVSAARVLLQDTVAPYRYSDADMIAELNLAILEAKRVRPDLFFEYRGKHPYPTFVSPDRRRSV